MNDDLEELEQELSKFDANINKNINNYTEEELNQRDAITSKISQLTPLWEDKFRRSSE